MPRQAGGSSFEKRLAGGLTRKRSELLRILLIPPSYLSGLEVHIEDKDGRGL